MPICQSLLPDPVSLSNLTSASGASLGWAPRLAMRRRWAARVLLKVGARGSALPESQSREGARDLNSAWEWMQRERVRTGCSGRDPEVTLHLSIVSLIALRARTCWRCRSSVSEHVAAWERAGSPVPNAASHVARACAWQAGELRGRANEKGRALS